MHIYALTCSLLTLQLEAALFAEKPRDASDSIAWVISDC